MKKLFFILSISLLPTLGFGEQIAKENVSQMVDSMVQQGIIPQSEAERVKQKLSGMSAQEWSQINQQAEVLAKQYGEQNKVVDNDAQSAANNIDFDGAMFEDIQSKVKAAMQKKEEHSE